MSKMLKKVSVALSLVVSAGAMAQEQAGMYYTQPSTVPIDEYLEQISNAEEVEEGLRRGRIFAFWNDCKPLGLAVQINPHNEDLYVSVHNAIESRLRSARLKNDEEAWGFLRVNINTFNRLFSIEFGLYKNFFDEELNQMGSAETWDTGSFGHYSSDLLILSLVSRHIDDFLNTYLRVNEDTCVP